METHVEHLDASTVRLTVTVSAEEVDESIDEAYKRMAKKIKIPGFRKGKAPKPVIDTHVGKDAVVADAQDEVLNESYGKALDAEGLRPTGQPEIDEFEPMEAGEEFAFVAEVPVRPELTLSGIEDLEITVPTKTATDADIDREIDGMRDRFASLEPVEDRGIETNDFALISFVGTVDGEAYDGNTVDKYLYEMNRGLMPPEFEEGITGLKAGDETRVEFEIPDSSSNPEYVGKSAAFDVTVHEVKAKVLPEVDDEFASNVGGYDSVQEMRDSLRERLDQTKEMAHKRALENKSRIALAERLQGDVPETMIENTRQQMLRDLMNSLESREMSMDDYLAVTGITLEQLRDDIAEQAAQAVREELALEALFRHLDLELSDDDIDSELSLFVQGTERTAQQLREQWEETGVIAVVREQIMHKHAVNWLLENVKITESDEAGVKDVSSAGDEEPADAPEETDDKE